MANDYIRMLAEESLNDKLVLFVGSGVSINSGLPDWDSLISSFCNYLDLNDSDKYTNEEKLKIPQIFYDKFGKVKYYELLEDFFKDNELEPNSIHEKLYLLKPNYIITTNYDNLLEKRFNRPKSYNVITKDEDLAHSRNNKMIIKMHGDFDNKNIVLKKSDYKNYQKNFPLISTFIKSLFTTNTVLFIGYSLSDINLRNILNWIKEILDEDFRRVYLTDFSSSNIVTDELNQSDKTVNKIFLYDYVSKEDKEKEEILSGFLQKIIDQRNDLEENPVKLLKRLFYIPNFYIEDETNSKKLDLSLISFKDNWTKNIRLNKKDIHGSSKINFDKLDKELFNDFKKSHIISVNNKNIIDEKLRIKFDELRKIIDLLTKNNFDELNNYLNKLSNISSLLKGYCYFYKGDYDESIYYLENKLNDFKDPVLTLWTKHNLNSVYRYQKIKNKDNTFNEDKYKLDVEYDLIFTSKNTDLYKEISNNDLIYRYKSELNDIFFEIKQDKNTTFYGTLSGVEKARNIFYDMFLFIMINCYIKSMQHKYKSIIYTYIEIIMFAYTNKNEESNEFFDFPKGMGSKNVIEEFEFIDLYFMSKLKYKKLKSLIDEYDINSFEVSFQDQKDLIITLNNYFDNSLDTNIYHSYRLKSFFKIVSMINFDNDLKDDLWSLLTSEYFLKQQDHRLYYLLINIIEKNKNLISQKVLNKLINQLLFNETINQIDNTVIGYLTYLYDDNDYKKLEDIDNILYELGYNDVLKNRNFEDIKEKDIENIIYISRIVNEELKKKIKDAVESYIMLDKDNFNINICILAARLELIDFKKYDDNVIEKIKEKYDNDYKFKYNDKYIFTSIIALNLDRLSSESFKDELNNLENQKLDKWLSENNYYNLYKYSLGSENIKFEDFKIRDLKLLRSKGLKTLLKKDENNYIAKLVKEDLLIKYNDEKLKVILDYYIN